MAQLLERPSEEKAKVAQAVDFRTGNEMAARAAKQINFHLMGYYPITPSTEVPEFLDEMKAEGEHSIRMIPADGEHGAAGICFGATTGGLPRRAREPQAVYDMNIVALRIGEHPKVRLPVIVAYDGFFTSHQKRRVQYFTDDAVVQNFVGKTPEFPHALDPRHP